MRVTSSMIAALLLALQAAPPAQLTTALLDLPRERWIEIDREPQQYLGHPTTVVLDDGVSVLCVYPKGHGKGAIQLKRSADGGQSWSERLATPASWETSQETPTIHRVKRADGKTRLLLFSGLKPIRQARSDDGGASWSELEPIGEFGGIVAMASLEQFDDGRLMAFFHDDGRFIGEGVKLDDGHKFHVFVTESKDCGATWSAPRAIASRADVDLCEPGVLRSPDGKRLVALLRENRRAQRSFFIASDDQGRSWSEPAQLSPELTGDRHVARYAADGRLVIALRDMFAGSPSRGDWLLWVGTFEDVVNAKPGAYRVRLGDNQNAWDSAYCGLERLADGTMLCVTYGHWDKDAPPWIVGVRFKLEEFDARLGAGR